VVNSFIWHKPLLYWSFELSYWVALPIVVFALAMQRTGLGFADLGLHTTLGNRQQPWLLLLMCLLFSLVAYAVEGMTRGLAIEFIHSGGLFGYGQVMPADPMLHRVVAIYFALTAAIVEELYFRGWLYRLCQRAGNPQLLFVSVSTPLFALIHWENGPGDTLVAAVVGLFFALSYLELKNLWPLITAHFIIDLINFS